MTKFALLQLFSVTVNANGVDITATAAATQSINTTGSTGLSAENKTHYDKTLLRSAKPNLVHAQFAQKRPIPRNGGKTIEFRKYSALPKAMTPLTEGVTPIGNSLSVSAITATVAQYGDYVTISDVLDLTGIDKNIVEATQVLGNQAGLTVDAIYRNVLVTTTSSLNAPKVASDGTETAVTARANFDKTALLTPKMVWKAVRQLKNKNAPRINGDYVAIIHPDVAYDLMRSDEWIDVHKYDATGEIFSGEIGRLAGCRFVESTEAKVWIQGSGAAACPAGLAVYATMFLGANAYGIVDIEGAGLQTIVKQKGSAGTEDPLDQRASVGWKALTTGVILANEFMVKVESCSSRSDDMYDELHSADSSSTGN